MSCRALKTHATARALKGAGAGWWLALVAAISTGQAAAQSVEWRTNYYAVSGSDMRELRANINRARPGKGEFDAETAWNVNWRYSVERADDGCRCKSVTTTVSITMTLPRWADYTNASPEMKARWAAFIVPLLEHEVGHGKFGLGAANELRKQLGELRAEGGCDGFRRKVEETAQRVIDDFKKRERNYDVRTDHGRKK
jgi:predicted secreted Zn-dependent protease